MKAKLSISLTGALVATALLGGGAFVAYKLFFEKKDQKPADAGKVPAGSGSTPTTNNGTTPAIGTPPNGNTGIVPPPKVVKDPTPIFGILPGENGRPINDLIFKPLPIGKPVLLDSSLDPTKTQLTFIDGKLVTPTNGTTPPINTGHQDPMVYIKPQPLFDPKDWRLT
ncbi:hypothetical protein [Deinococcus cellulosilyticus]|uniref:Uncharacterized protein n=1 Tax=Deinococcus cellulosilyticus (strain DSM 18568 / NBRC 106333 / KACC 11606 / 5516J-15) TaxID=1223518 RepID=A0A511MYS1_DEIC1|nr:hypothetical protein [Deinococcus cellulosilyticus]GEM45306.1 hypothetical protein DC3_09410 [Deinococcus cellulosilyticus NBRC 106333 = KACC 11606]